MWLALILLLGNPIAIEVESQEMCMEIVENNIDYWRETGQHGEMMCIQVLDI